MADPLDDRRGYRRGADDIFRHYGICPSNGNLDSCTSPVLLREFADECTRRFIVNGLAINEQNQIQRIASWMYLACPPPIISHVRRNLRMNVADISSVDLNTIGLCWCEADDMKSFFFALENRLRLGIVGVNNWLRACRDIVRFRDAALHPDIIQRRNLELIMAKIIRILDGEIQQNHFNVIFKNCVLTCLFLLKRRRYEDDFFDINGDGCCLLVSILDNLLIHDPINLHDNNKAIVKVTLDFLRKKGSLDILDSSVLEG
jgi:hypothetical protein